MIACSVEGSVEMMIAEINNEEDKRLVLGDLLCNDMYNICMQCFQGSRGVNKKPLESESGSLIEGTSCCRESFFKSRGSPYRVGHSP